MLTLILRSFPSILLLSCTFLVRPNLALHVTPGSNCLATCSQASSNTLEADVVCTDAEYSSTANGTRFQSCVQCELGSTAVDAQTGETDVGWGVCKTPFFLSERSGGPQAIVLTSFRRQPSLRPLYLRIWLSYVEKFTVVTLPGVMHATKLSHRAQAEQYACHRRLQLL